MQCNIYYSSLILCKLVVGIVLLGLVLGLVHVTD